MEITISFFRRGEFVDATPTDSAIIYNRCTLAGTKPGDKNCKKKKKGKNKVQTTYIRTQSCVDGGGGLEKKKKKNRNKKKRAIELFASQLNCLDATGQSKRLKCPGEERISVFRSCSVFFCQRSPASGTTGGRLYGKTFPRNDPKA